MHELCTLTADLTPLMSFFRAPVPLVNPGFPPFYEIPFTVTASLGGNCLQARITWFEGVSTYRLWFIIYDPSEFTHFPTTYHRTTQFFFSPD